MVSLALIGLLLASSISSCHAVESSQHPTYSATQHRNGNNGLHVIGGDSYSLGTKLRQRRALSPFQSAWKALLRTTDRQKLARGPRVNTIKYTKVGSISDAVDDFFALKPSGIQNQGGVLYGHVNGLRQTIILDTHSVDTPVLFLTSGKSGSKKVVSRSIIYTPRVH